MSGHVLAHVVAQHRRMIDDGILRRIQQGDRPPLPQQTSKFFDHGLVGIQFLPVALREISETFRIMGEPFAQFCRGVAS